MLSVQFAVYKLHISIYRNNILNYLKNKLIRLVQLIKFKINHIEIKKKELHRPIALPVRYRSGLGLT